MYAFSLYRCPQCCYFYDPMALRWVNAKWLSMELLEVCLKPIYKDIRILRFLIAVQANTSEYAKTTCIHMPSLTGNLRYTWNVVLRYNILWLLCGSCEKANVLRRSQPKRSLPPPSHPRTHSVGTSVKRALRHAWTQLTSCHACMTETSVMESYFTSHRPHTKSLSKLDGDCCKQILTFLSTSDLQRMNAVSTTWAFWSTLELQSLQRNRFVEVWNKIAHRGVFVNFTEVDTSKVLKQQRDARAGSSKDYLEFTCITTSMEERSVKRGGFLMLLPFSEADNETTSTSDGKWFASEDTTVALPALTNIKWTYIHPQEGVPWSCHPSEQPPGSPQRSLLSPVPPSCRFDPSGFPLFDLQSYLLPPQQTLLHLLESQATSFTQRIQASEGSGVLCKILEWQIQQQPTGSTPQDKV